MPFYPLSPRIIGGALHGRNTLCNMVKLFFPFSNPSPPLAIPQSGRGIASSRHKFCHTILALEAADVDAPIRALCWSISAGERRKGRRQEDYWSKIGQLAAMAKVSSISRFILSAVSSCRRGAGLSGDCCESSLPSHTLSSLSSPSSSRRSSLSSVLSTSHLSSSSAGGGSGSPHHHRGRLSFARGTASSVFCFGCLEFEI